MAEGKIKNARKVDSHGIEITNLARWKEKHPGELYFDSVLEWFAWKEMTKRGIKFVLKPDNVELIPKFTTLDFDHPKTVKSEIVQQQKLAKQEATSKAKSDPELKKLMRKFKSDTTRSFNKLFKKEIVEVTSASMGWDIDFFLTDFNCYVECKGHPNDAFPNKLKLGRYQIPYPILIVHTQKDIIDLMDYLENNSHISGAALKEIGNDFEDKLVELFYPLFPDIVRTTDMPLDGEKIDFINTGLFNIQAKSTTFGIPYAKILDSMPSTKKDGKINLIIHEFAKQLRESREVEGQYAVMKLEDLLKLISLIQEKILHGTTSECIVRKVG